MSPKTPPTPEKMSFQLRNAIKEIESICDDPSSKSDAFEYGSIGYKESIRHFLASSSQIAQLAVQPGNIADLAKIMKVLNRRQVKFAVKGGGHGMAPTFSSTTGIQISMARFQKVQYNTETKTVAVGAGCLWDQVYSKLAPSGRNVIGGASAGGVGVAGWLLGGGYSLKSNRYGLGIDHVVEYEIVTADGRDLRVNAESEPKLFQALRGGGNNFGIVTKFVLKTYPQNPTYGGWLVVRGSGRTREACIIPAFRHKLVSGKVEYYISVLCVFDAEKPELTRDVPFQQFLSLAETGTVWTADPAGWRLGKTEIIPEVKMRPADLPSRFRMRNVRGLTSPSIERQEAWGLQKSVEDRGDKVNQSFGDLDTFAYEDGSGIADELLNRTFRAMSYDHRWRRPTSERPPTYISDDIVDDSDDEDFAENIFSDTDDSDEASSDTKEGTAEPDEEREGDPQGQQLPQKIMVNKKIDSMGELNERGRFASLMISKYTKPLLNKMEAEAKRAAGYLESHRGLSVIVDAWPVHPAIFDQSPPGAAFPHERGQPYGPMLLYFRWQDEADDAFWLSKLEGTLTRIRVFAHKLGLTPTKPALYSNLPLETVPTHRIYRENMTWLKQVKEEYDPTNVMGNAGGYKIPLPHPPQQPVGKASE